MATEKSDADKIVAAIEDVGSELSSMYVVLDRIEDAIGNLAQAVYALVPATPEDDDD